MMELLNSSWKILYWQTSQVSAFVHTITTPTFYLYKENVDKAMAI